MTKKIYVAELSEYPLAKTSNFTHGFALDADGKETKTLENNLIGAYKEQYKNQLKKQYGTNWKHHFQHPVLLYSLNEK